MTARPRRQHIHDRITGSGLTASADVIRCDFVTGPFDEAVRAADLAWGVDRLPDLVSIQTAERWGDAIAKLNAAIDAGDVETTKARVAACIRGLAVMDAEARAAGHAPADPDVWEVEHDGLRLGLIRDPAQWQAAAHKRPDLTIVSLAEAAVALAALRNTAPVVDAVKTHFPGAAITSIRKRPIEDDEIPF